MTHLRTVHLHGVLGERFGHEHHFALSSPREAVSALSANFPGFRAAFQEFPFYGIICDGDNRHPGNCPDVGNAPFADELHLVPMVEGRLGAVIVPALGAIGITGTAATIISSVLTIGLLFGLSLLFAPKAPDTDTEKDENYLFNGPENTTVQGAAVPLIYGRCFVGSVVASYGIEVSQGVGGNNGEGRNYTWSSPQSFVVERTPARRRLDLPEPIERPQRWSPVNG